MAKKLTIGNKREATPKKTSIGASKHTNYNKARHKKHGKKKYRGQGR